MNIWIILPMFISAAAGIFLLVSSFADHLKGRDGKENLHNLHLFVGTVLLAAAVLAVAAAWTGEKEITLFYLMKDIPVYFHVDAVGRLFVTFVSIVWVCVGIYSFVYMKHEGEEKRFYGFFLLVYSVLIALDFSGNLVTMYLFYELMTLTSMPLVLHNGSREAIMASLKYLFYSMCGAYAGLFGIFYLYRYCDTLAFVPGGSLSITLASGHEGVLLWAVMAMLIGFGAKAGMFPLHAWLPTAHPVAPSPASAALSSIIVKSGVLAIIRVVYYMVGADFLRGTWVQTAWMTLALMTVFMGSLLAFREPVFKKRLAYSTVSQVSYILFGLSVLEPQAMSGALLHVVFHAFIKSTLFLTAGIFIFQCGKTRVKELRGIGKQMPVTLWCYTFASLALIGIPPTSGFISKWHLAEGALSGNIGAFRYVGPAVLLVSALLTAGYLLPVTISGFLPGEDWNPDEKSAGQEESHKSGKKSSLEPSIGMLLPLAILACLAVLLGVFPNPLLKLVNEIASMVL
ncbi:MAG: proton-conducting transporter membrane subunit [Eubacteriales bacterium]|nr:proton-conducting transporter membrane subunit [Eubacteriales bacterium]